MQITTAVLLLAGLATLIGLVAARQSSLAEWQRYKHKHGKVYTDKTEDAMRFSMFLIAKDKINKHNLDTHSKHKLGLNHLADLTPVEFAQLNGLKYNRDEHKRRLESSKGDSLLRTILEGDSDVSDAVDWRKVPGRVTPVKNQYHCGSCWAFSTTGLLEGQEFHVRNNNGVALSEQELVECSKRNKGCDGGIMSDALSDISELGGLETEREYPYVAPVVNACSFNKTKAVFSDTGSVDLPDADEEVLKKTVARYGPVAIAVSANDKLRLYNSGVFRDPECTTDLNHGVLIVGYGTDKEEGDYWIVKNSWGPEWGEGGYFRIARGEGMCGIGILSTIATF